MPPIVDLRRYCRLLVVQDLNLSVCTRHILIVNLRNGFLVLFSLLSLHHDLGATLEERHKTASRNDEGKTSPTSTSSAHLLQLFTDSHESSNVGYEPVNVIHPVSCWKYSYAAIFVEYQRRMIRNFKYKKKPLFHPNCSLSHSKQ